MEYFEALNVKSILRRRNVVTDALVISVSALQPMERMKLKRFLEEKLWLPHLFQITLLTSRSSRMINTFSISLRAMVCLMYKKFMTHQMKKLEGDELEDEDVIIDLKNNTIPKGMVELECIFDQDELAHNKRTNEEKGIREWDPYNLGMKDDPKMVRIGKACDSQEQ